MKASLEDTSIQHRGVILTSETDEEREVLRDIWCSKGRPASLGKLDNGSIELVVAPTSDDQEVKMTITTMTLEEIITKVWNMAWSCKKLKYKTAQVDVVWQDTLKWALTELNERAEICVKAGKMEMVDLLDKYHPEWRDYIKAVMTKEDYQAKFKELGI